MITASIEVKSSKGFYNSARQFVECGYHAEVRVKGALVNTCAHFSPTAEAAESNAQAWIASEKGQYQIKRTLCAQERK